MSALIYSSLPESFKTPFWFAVCLMQETNQLFYSMSSVSFIFQVHILFQGALNRAIKSLTRSSGGGRSDRDETSWILGQVRTIQLLVTLFNTGHRNVLYCTKLACISIATVNGYGAIGHGGKNPIFGFLNFSVTVNAIFLYTFVYEKGFAIPEALKSIKKMLGVRTQGVQNKRDRAILRRRIESIPFVGLRVGNFHMLERMSTPIFIHYVLTSIVHLLVTLK